MVKIYVLLDPRNSLPFYVGSTCKPLKDRLNSHLTKTNRHIPANCNTDIMRIKRMNLLNELSDISLKPIIKTLFVTNEHSAAKCEKVAYLLLLSKGYELYQCADRLIRNNIPHSSHFH